MSPETDFKGLFEIISSEINKNILVKSDAIVQAVLNAIDKGVLSHQDQLPSVNQAVEGIGVARKTIVKAYKSLITMGNVEARPRHGYFIKSEETSRSMNVMLVLHGFNAFQEQLYNSFIDTLGPHVHVDVYFHHCNAEVLKGLIRDRVEHYQHFVITPFEHPSLRSIISLLPHDSVLIIDQLADLTDYHHVVQDFNTSLYESFISVRDDIRKYREHVLVHPDNQFIPAIIDRTIDTWFHDHNLHADMVTHVDELHERVLYITISDSDMADILDAADRQRLKPGVNFGLLSFNDSPLKKYVRNGITTVSCDFSVLGQMAAETLKSGNVANQTVSLSITKRSSV